MKIRKKIFLVKMLTLFLYLCLSWSGLFSQQLEIHHINVNNGDATVIAGRDENDQYQFKILIDGGKRNYNFYLRPYINAVFGNTHFNLVIMTHYHDDHYNGLIALRNAAFTADYVIDPGGYTLNNVAPSPGNPPLNANLNPPQLVLPPTPPSDRWKIALKTYGNQHNTNFKRVQNIPGVQSLSNFPADIRNTVILDRIGGVAVRLRCIAGVGSNIDQAGNIHNSIIPGRNNPNNFTLAFLLTWGEFRYYTAGDMGGYQATYAAHDGSTINCNSYLDQETAVAQGLHNYVGQVDSWDGVAFAREGHVCAMKTSHHGSACSNNQFLFATMQPAVCITSVGNYTPWKLPQPEFLYRLSQATPLSQHTPAFLQQYNGVFNRGIFFTNLVNYPGQASLTIANNYFQGHSDIAYDYGNNAPGSRGNYVLTVPYKVPTETYTIKEKSFFYVQRVDVQGANVVIGARKWFLCHCAH